MAADNAAGLERLDQLIERLRNIEDLPKRAAPEIAKALDKSLRAQIAAGTDPAGTPWRRTKDGRVPLRGAAAHLTVIADGTRVVAQLTGPEARHHLGAVKGGIRRQILPSRGLAQPVIAAIRGVLARYWRGEA